MRRTSLRLSSNNFDFSNCASPWTETTTELGCWTLLFVPAKVNIGSIVRLSLRLFDNRILRLASWRRWIIKNFVDQTAANLAVANLERFVTVSTK